MIIGPGHLGCRIAILWKQEFSESSIFLKTRSFNEARANRWKDMGFFPLSEEQPNEYSSIKCPYVVFSAPPTGNDLNS